MDIEAQRTLVKSPPELWGLLSDAESLARQLADFGEVRIVSTQPETAIAWEGEAISGTIALKASGWGTKVTLTAAREAPEPVAPPAPEPKIEPEPALEPELTAEPKPAAESGPAPEPEPEPKLGFFARIFRRRKPVAVVEPEAHEPEPEAVIEPEPEPEPEAPEPERPDLAAELLALEESLAAETTAVLNAVLDRLGAAHHRPFSRA
jgi:hypothetical protein